jgi:archaellum component FlaC
MEDYITRQEHEAVVQRIEAEENRQNTRISAIEKRVDDLYDMKSSISVIDLKIDTISKDLTRLSKDVEELKAEPADNWKSVKRTILTVIVTALATAAIAAIFHFA